MAITIAKSPAGKLPRTVTLLDGVRLEGNYFLAAGKFLYHFLFVGLHFPQISARQAAGVRQKAKMQIVRFVNKDRP